jgi:hypothetical protein
MILGFDVIRMRNERESLLIPSLGFFLIMMKYLSSIGLAIRSRIAVFLVIRFGGRVVVYCFSAGMLSEKVRLCIMAIIAEQILLLLFHIVHYGASFGLRERLRGLGQMCWWDLGKRIGSV